MTVTVCRTKTRRVFVQLELETALATESIKQLCKRHWYPYLKQIQTNVAKPTPKMRVTKPRGKQREYARQRLK